MAENKTKATAASVDSYIASIPDESRRVDCKTLASIMAKASKLPAVMWGTSIVGFGVYRYPLAGGKVGEICAAGFSSRKGDISIYGLASAESSADKLARLGKHKMGKGCLYVARLSDIDLKVLEGMVSQAVKAKHAGSAHGQTAA